MRGHAVSLVVQKDDPGPAGQQVPVLEAVVQRDQESPTCQTAKGWRGKNASIDAAHRVHARVEDAIRTGKDTGIGRFPSHDFTVNQAWLTAAMTAPILLCWLKLIALDGDLARAEPKTAS